ncbi:DUF4982 domain-containing protein [Parabacteroides faecis]|uniref:glycoside hydrolase family 2 TIM barrel-domain containing protein n=1 Tax=Parabacteroides faecis TaxID=1217282 RepID=UPI0021649AF5|nr:glycoside hydrolase family 2 TIM barrel-domain containing protein [Parabacteroides faecis]MCS2889766.1 DUF4982 domain-containing protein [Parabacteroides faecis]UVQ46529.1 DUF4982 domain-containing protein [Parabacteroides faecis]
MKNNIIVLLLLSLWAFPTHAQNRYERSLEKGWRFSRMDGKAVFGTVFDDSDWQKVRVPHDWAIYGPFDINNDPQYVAIVQDGEKKASLKAGRTGGLPFVGTAWYRLRFDAPEFDIGKRATILFDGAMSNARVWLNGHYIGNWANGYNAFYFDITDYLKQGDNVLAVRLENLPESSRWYPGAGLYRNVHLIITEDVHIPVWGTYITTPVVRKDYACVSLRTTINKSGNQVDKFLLKTSVKDASGKQVAFAEDKLPSPDENTFGQNFVITQPDLWSPDSPSLYIAESELYLNGILKDTYTTRFGIRNLEIIPRRGMTLNGEPIKFRGVCNHHDLGPLGAAVNKSALRRQLVLLKELGCNAIRTSHNMPAPELVELCDEMGFMVMVETFDEWRTPKMKNGYNLLFDEWAERDLVNVIHNFRNNPSVMMWCIGNEVPDQSSTDGAKIARYLRDICHREDPTRFVTSGIDRVQDAIDMHYADVMDVVGFNYRTHLFNSAYEQLPNQILMGCETASTFSSRGVYYFPVKRTQNTIHSEGQSSSYDLEHGSWSNLPEDDFVLNDDYPWYIGQFVWTGFDYLGEPTPYYESWPNHSSTFGILDLAGLPKDRYYLYRSQWNTQKPTLHILPHWTWPGREGETTPVFVYTNYPAAELFVNGRSQGIVRKDTTMTEIKTANPEATENLSRQRRYRLMWPEVKYEPGSVKAVALNDEGKAVFTQEVHTAGKPCRIELSADRTKLLSDGKDLAFITVRVVDKQGNLCPHASNSVQFCVTGAGSYRAAANGDPRNLEMFHEPRMSLFNGQLVAIVQSAESKGEIEFEATVKGLPKAILKLKAED